MTEKRGPVANGGARGAAFNAQAFLDSAGVAKTVVQYGRGEAIFTQGDPCAHVMYINPAASSCRCCRRPAERPSWRCSGPETSSARAAWRASRSAWAAPRRSRRARSCSSSKEQDGAAAAQAARDVRPLHRAHAGAQHPDRRGPDRSALQLEREAAGAHAAAAGALRQAGQAGPRRCRRSRRRRSPRWSARRARA